MTIREREGESLQRGGQDRAEIKLPWRVIHNSVQAGGVSQLCGLNTESWDLFLAELERKREREREQSLLVASQECVRSLNQKLHQKSQPGL